MKKIYICLLLILFIAAFLRLYRLAENPPSLYWDEASLGYNAFSILTTGHDEHGEKLPLNRFIAFGDYKPPGYIYTLVPILKVFGVNEFAIRFPSALAGILMVYLTYVLACQLFPDKKSGIIAAGLLAISPWSLQLSRAAFEGNLAAMFNLGGVVAFLGSRQKKWLLPLSVLLFILSFYTFNANRIIAPLLFGLLCIISFKDIWLAKKWMLISLILGLVLLWPSFAYFQARESRLRFDEVSIFNDLNIIEKSNQRITRSGDTWWAKIIFNRRVIFAQQFLIHYFDNFKAEFLFIKGDTNPRLSTQEVGELYIWELPLLIIGFYQLIKTGIKKNVASLLIIGWMIIAPIPASVARETPHALRTVSILPTYQIVSGIGVMVLWRWLKLQKKWLKYGIFSLFTMAILITLSDYFHNYWIHYPQDWSGEWQYGYKQMVQKVSLLENNYDEVQVTSKYGRPYIYFLLYKQINPLEYVKVRRADRDWYGFWNVYGFGKYSFDGSKTYNKKTLFVDGPGTISKNGRLIDVVKDLKGDTVFEIGEQ
jgi:4-amino-4-deoxy-L-arabinose transferase-like glycosyltransferase